MVFWYLMRLGPARAYFGTLCKWYHQRLILVLNVYGISEGLFGYLMQMVLSKANFGI